MVSFLKSCSRRCFETCSTGLNSALMAGGATMLTERTSCLFCQAAEVAHLTLRRPAAAGTVIWPFEGWTSEHHQRRKTNQIAHHRPSLTS